MAIKDILNRDVVNIDNCESEPIHIPGSIQPHGFLLALSRKDHLIQYCSENSTDHLQLDITDILGKSFSSIFDCNFDLQVYEDDTYDASKPFQCSYRDTVYSVSAHVHSDIIILEFEPLPDGRLELPNLYQQTQKFLSVIQNTSSLKQLCQSISEEVRAVTGYDRVMVYRFDKQYNGEVYAEALRDDLESFLGLHYPHTDIPVQARKLYLQNTLRIIVDVNYKPVPIFTNIDNADNNSLNLSSAILRSVSPIHIEYLKNMGVNATLTISLIHEKKLWGLIACHHYSPKNIPHYIRLTALLEGNFLSSQIKAREVSEEFALAQVVDSRLQSVLEVLNNSDSISDYISDAGLRQFVDADGVAIIDQDHIYANGNVPASDSILKLAHWLNSRSSDLVTSSLGGVYPDANAFKDTSAGIMYFSLHKVNNVCVIWFRGEIEKTVYWAGEPDKAIVIEEKGLSPRKSFAAWKEVVKGNSKEWRNVEINAAAKCVYALQKQFTLISTRREEEKLRVLTEKLKLANEELSNLNWIGSHDLKEPLRKIQVFASKILLGDTKALDPGTADLIERMRRSAGRMQLLIDDIMNYSRISNKEEHFTNVDLDKVIADVQAELEVTGGDSNITLHVGKMPVICGVNFQVRQLFINLLSNAVKFSRDNVTAAITISAGTETRNGRTYHTVTVADNGIGFEEKYEDLIFNVFKRLNNTNTYEGTGIGLAICKKIMEVHDGFIEASGRAGEGADFTVFFPIA